MLRTKTYPDARSAYMALKIIYFALIAGVLGFMAVSFVITTQESVPVMGIKEVLLIPALLVTLLSIPAGYLFSSGILAKISADMEFKDKITKYHQVFLPRIATCEGSALFSLVCFLVSANYVFIALAAISLAVMLLLYPSVSRLQADLNLSDSEADQLGGRVA